MDSINPQILPLTRPRKEHHRAAIVGVWVTGVAILIGLTFWLRTPQSVEIPVVENGPDPIKAAQVEEASVIVPEILTADQIKIKEAQLKAIPN